jgi:hypothetical protein
MREVNFGIIWTALLAGILKPLSLGPC